MFANSRFVWSEGVPRVLKMQTMVPMARARAQYLLQVNKWELLMFIIRRPREGTINDASAFTPNSD